MTDMPTILYIAGYSRSGSTILDIVLGNHSEIASTGELVYLLDDAQRDDRHCTCGEPFTECPIYGGWLANQPDPQHINEIIREIESRDGLKALMVGNIDPQKAAIYRAYARSLYGHIAAQTGASVILDSSKSARDAAGRPLALRVLAGLDVKMLHLTRSAEATVNSYLQKGSNWVLEGYRAPKRLESWRPILGWHHANRIAADLARSIGTDYLHIRFEDFVADPRKALAQIGALLGKDLGAQAKNVVAGQAFIAGHNVGGNRHRMTPQPIHLEQPPVPHLPLGHAVALHLLASGTARRLGY